MMMMMMMMMMFSEEGRCWNYRSRRSAARPGSSCCCSSSQKPTPAQGSSLAVVGSLSLGRLYEPRVIISFIHAPHAHLITQSQLTPHQTTPKTLMPRTFDPVLEGRRSSRRVQSLPRRKRRQCSSFIPSMGLCVYIWASVSTGIICFFLIQGSVEGRPGAARANSAADAGCRSTTFRKLQDGHDKQQARRRAAPSSESLGASQLPTKQPRPLAVQQPSRPTRITIITSQLCIQTHPK
jgi:hypothetical protein